MRVYLFITLPLLLLSSISGCQSPVRPAHRILVDKDVVEYPPIIKWCSFRTGASEQWLMEARRRWTDPVVFICHGGYREILLRGDNEEFVRLRVWVAVPDEPRSVMWVTDLAVFLTNLYPNRDIVLITCNEFGHDLFVPRVWYAKSDVWQIPDNYDFYNSHERMIGEGSVGNIYEFVTMGGSLVNNSTTQPSINPATQPTTMPTSQPTSQPTDPAIISVGN